MRVLAEAAGGTLTPTLSRKREREQDGESAHE